MRSMDDMYAYSIVWKFCLILMDHCYYNSMNFSAEVDDKVESHDEQENQIENEMEVSFCK